MQFLLLLLLKWMFLLPYTLCIRTVNYLSGECVSLVVVWTIVEFTSDQSVVNDSTQYFWEKGAHLEMNACEIIMHLEVFSRPSTIMEMPYFQQGQSVVGVNTLSRIIFDGIDSLMV